MNAAKTKAVKHIFKILLPVKAFHYMQSNSQVNNSRLNDGVN